MKYQINVRKLDDNDFSRDCNFPVTEPTEYKECLALLATDIEQLQPIVSVSLVGNGIQIETELTESELLDTVKTMFQRVFCEVRFISVEKLA
jgi:hypothetical protein